MLQNGAVEYSKRKNEEISNNIRKALDGISGESQNTKMLVELEAKIDKIRRNEQKFIQSEYADLVKWLIFILGTSTKFSEDQIAQIHRTAKEVFQMMGKVDE